MPIETVADLREQLQVAIRVELSTIPPYLYAMYSIADSTSEGAQLIRSIAAEEMLHATLAANVLLAIGGEPRFYDADVMPRFPSPLLHHEPELMVNLEPFSSELVERLFLRIEQPATPGAHVSPGNWESQGQLYRELEHALRRLDAELGVFHQPQTERQLHDPHNYSAVRYDSDASGGLVKVDSIDRAMDALEVMIHQGEGLSDERYADEGHAELTHYWKFRRVLENASDVGAIHQAVRNPTIDRLPDEVRPLARFSNATYSYLFVIMDRLFASDTPNRQELVGVLYGSMVGLVGPVAKYLMTVPISASEVAGPPFEHFEFSDPDKAEQELREMAGALFDAHPDLAPVFRQLDRLPS